MRMVISISILMMQNGALSFHAGENICIFAIFVVG